MELIFLSPLELELNTAPIGPKEPNVSMNQKSYEPGYQIVAAIDPFELEDALNDILLEVEASGDGHVQFVGAPLIKKAASFQAIVVTYFEDAA